MAIIPRPCNHCGRLVHHYGACVCPDAQLELIEAERDSLRDRLKLLDAREREVLGLIPETQD